MNLSKTSIDQILEGVQSQIYIHGEDHVDLVIEHEKKIAYIMFHSRHNSFNLSENFNLKEIDKKNLITKAKKLGYSIWEK